MYSVDTIVALATPLGRSGIGVIRLSGDDALSIVRSIVNDKEFAPEPRQAILHQLYNTDGSEVIDSALITYFRAPHSFTGEDVVEISCHGSPVLLRLVIDECLSLGARMAEPGEFSLRALAHGRMDLTEAEAIRDLIDAQTIAAARQAVRQMSGEFSHQLQPIKDELLDVIVFLESALEFVEDDLPQLQVESLGSRLRSVADSIAAMAATYRAGHLVREGIRVAIVGRPNVGKSSLFNALVGNDRAIVTEIPGTTRDEIRERFIVENIPVSLVDTAGLRETVDTVEKIGVERARRTMIDADLVMAVVDVTDNYIEEDLAILESVAAMQHVIVLNKIDKAADESVEGFRGRLLHGLGGDKRQTIEISAKSGAGLDTLKSALIKPFSPSDMNLDGFLVSDARHFDLLRRANEEVTSSADLLKAGTTEEIVLVGLHNALRFLGEITGETTTEDMLTRIFSTFCIGK
jgi:tRNA modification GTPase